ncbi:unnamed protein product [Toxocara canis]|uniref:Uncharacterized protein n=1 Tax=Toxocara canis TaxID=6265 RepID=A0A183V3V2_TOXCA|nr:unnamed protein product [Toxocara canis]
MASGNDLWNNQKTSSKVSKKTMNEFRNLCEGFLNNPDRVTKQVNAMVQEMSEKNKCAMKELAEIEKDIESMQQPCAFADIVFRTLYDRRLYNRAVVQQTPLILDHFKVNAKDSNVQLKLNDTSIAPFLWGQLEEWRRLEKDKPWQQRRRQSSEAIRAAEINRKRSLAMVESLQHDVALLQKIGNFSEKLNVGRETREVCLGFDIDIQVKGQAGVAE